MKAPQSPRCPIRVTLDAAGVVLLIFAAYVTAAHIWDTINFYDEGLLLTGARLVSRGAVPYRDFYSNYPPGIFVLIATLWELTGVKAIVLRYLALVVHFALAALAGRLAGRVSGRRFVPLASALVLSHTLVLGLVPYAYLIAVTLVLGFVELWLCALARPSKVRFALAGFLLGLVFAFRHDVFIYVCGALGLVGAASAIRRRALPDVTVLRGLAWAGLALAIPLEATWIPTFVLAGFRAVVNDLYFDQVRYVLPARVLPFPEFFPDSLYSAHPASLCLVLAGPVLAAIAALWARDHAARWPAILVGCVAAAVITQSIGRCDAHHVAFGVTPALILACGLVDELASQFSARVALRAFLPAAWLVTTAIGPLLVPTTADPSGATNPVPAARPLPMVAPVPRAEVLDFIAQHTKAGDPIFVGSITHRHVIASEVDLYFMADRPSAVRRSQFDPNVVTRAKFQKEMITELEQKRPNVAILSACCMALEENESLRRGAPLLDQYLLRKYGLVKTTGPYLLLLRRSDTATEEH
jgi:4-amino-4-deoxy-L-arabinose transferase-like glycosyltransferase